MSKSTNKRRVFKKKMRCNLHDLDDAIEGFVDYYTNFYDCFSDYDVMDALLEHVKDRLLHDQHRDLSAKVGTIQVDLESLDEYRDWGRGEAATVTVPVVQS